ncbi:hypothetical protein BH20VER1_BH20VER1_20380 [soil metagenome]
MATCATAVAETFTVRVDPPSAFHQFVPQFLTIAPGDTVRWVFDAGGHTVTSGDPNTGTPNGLFNSSLRAQGTQFSYTFPNPGTYDYFCSPHYQMGMNGSITVTSGPAPAAQLLNISTRLRVQTGEGAMIGGFIITGNASKPVIVRALGPSLTAQNVAGALENPAVQLHGSGGPIANNDNWRSSQEAAIIGTGVPPSNDLESALIATLAPGPYTAVVTGVGQPTGVGLVEVYDLDPAADSRLANISTRGMVETGSNVMIGGFILGRQTGARSVIVRAIGPSLAAAGINNALADPTLELRDANGGLVRSNNNWRESQEAEIIATGVPPSHNAESAIIATLPPAAYTAIVAGNGGGTGVALVEVYQL